MVTTDEIKEKRNEYMRQWNRKRGGPDYGKSKFCIKYTDDDIQFIKDNYKTMSNLQLSQKLSKSLASIKDKIKRMRLEGIDLIRNEVEMKEHRKNALGYMKSIGPRKYVKERQTWRKMTTLPDKRRVLTSHHVWCNTPGNLPYVPKGFVIHHIDLNPMNNESNNLFLMSNKLHNDIGRQVRGAL